MSGKPGFYQLFFLKEVANIFPQLHRVVETLVHVWEELKQLETLACMACRFRKHFTFSRTPLCFHNSTVQTWEMFSTS